MMVFLFAALVLTNKSIHPGNYTVDGQGGELRS